MNLVLLEQRRYRLRSHEFAAAGVNRKERNVWVDHPNSVFDQVAALVHLRNNPVSLVPAIRFNRNACPIGRLITTGQILKNPAVTAVILPGYYDPGLVTAFFRRYCGIDGYNDSCQLRRTIPTRPVKPVQVP